MVSREVGEIRVMVKHFSHTSDVDHLVKGTFATGAAFPPFSP